MEEMDTEERQQAVTKADPGPSSSEHGDTQPVEKKTFSLKQLLSSADLRRPLFIACMLQVIQQFSGINAVCIMYICYVKYYKSKFCSHSSLADCC
jgi:Sugar (and other) transporter